MGDTDFQPAQYDHFQHRHNFAVWAAARAAQRKWKSATVPRLRFALEASGIVEFLRRPQASNTDKVAFDRLHPRWCNAIMEHLGQQGVCNATYGRAAKLVAIYLKAMVVVGPEANSRLAHVAHPPVDRILLQNASRATDIRVPHKREWSRQKWTELDEDVYFRLIDQLRECLSDDEPMWHLEKYWTVTA